MSEPVDTMRCAGCYVLGSPHVLWLTFQSLYELARHNRYVILLSEPGATDAFRACVSHTTKRGESFLVYHDIPASALLGATFTSKRRYLVGWLQRRGVSVVMAA